jgi:hypothetical protein
MMIVDQCKHCVFRGDIKKCQAAECSQHESWYAKTLSYKVERLKEENEAQEMVMDLLMARLKYAAETLDFLDRHTHPRIECDAAAAACRELIR